MATTQVDIPVVGAPVKKVKAPKQSKPVLVEPVGAVITSPTKKAKLTVDTTVSSEAPSAKIRQPSKKAKLAAQTADATVPVEGGTAARASKKVPAAEKLDAVQSAGCPFAQGFVKALAYMLQNPVPNPVVQGSVIAALTFATGDNYVDPAVKGGILAAIIADTH